MSFFPFFFWIPIRGRDTGRKLKRLFLFTPRWGDFRDAVLLDKTPRYRLLPPTSIRVFLWTSPQGRVSHSLSLQTASKAPPPCVCRILSFEFFFPHVLHCPSEAPLTLFALLMSYNPSENSDALLMLCGLPERRVPAHP